MLRVLKDKILLYNTINLCVAGKIIMLGNTRSLRFYRLSVLRCKDFIFDTIDYG